jgi:2-polyprenyl-3-methyl-5-hydroxy-6-metoxy-1,4-benzoquinol methylase
MRDLASEQYAAQLKQLHANSQSFGVGNVTAKHYPIIKGLIQKRGFGSVLDYGCGKGHFLEFAKENFPGLQAQGFDVASDEYSTLPNEKFDMVVCLDVMEHVEYGALSNVLAEIRDRTSKVFICSVANYPAGKTLPDGRNAHVTQIPFSTWFTLFSGFFRVDQFMRTGKAEGLFICSAMGTSMDWR